MQAEKYYIELENRRLYIMDAESMRPWTQTTDEITIEQDRKQNPQPQTDGKVNTAKQTSHAKPTTPPTPSQKQKTKEANKQRNKKTTGSWREQTQEEWRKKNRTGGKADQQPD